MSGQVLRRSNFHYLLGKVHHLLGEGHLVNLAVAEGHPASVMDMSFENRALCAEHMNINAKSLGKVCSVPLDIDHEITRLKLVSMGVHLDELTAEQVKYLASWEEAT